MNVPRASDDRALIELRLALGRPTPEIPFRYRYDGEGPALQEVRAQGPACYVDRAEAELLSGCAREVLDLAHPRGFAEMASGEGHALRVLLTEAGGTVMRCALLDTHAEQLKRAARRLRQRHRGLVVRAVEGDLREDLGRLGPGGGRVVMLVSGTFGHLHPGAVPGWLARLRSALGVGDAVLLGLDTAPAPVLTASWSDDASEALNRNALPSVNTRWDADFPADDFEHATAWDDALDLLELRLVARRPVSARVGALDQTVELGAGDMLRTGFAVRWPFDRLATVAKAAGFEVARWWDGDGRYALAMLLPVGGPRTLAIGPKPV